MCLMYILLLLLSSSLPNSHWLSIGSDVIMPIIFVQMDKWLICGTVDQLCVKI